MNYTNSNANFNAPIPALPARPLVEGCIIRVTSSVVYFDERYHNAPFLITEVTFPDGMTLPDKLFLGTLTKSLVTPDIYDFANGTVNQLVRKCTDWSDALRKLENRQLRVAKVKIYTVERPDGHHLTKILDIDLVD